MKISSCEGTLYWVSNHPHGLRNVGSTSRGQCIRTVALQAGPHPVDALSSPKALFPIQIPPRFSTPRPPRLTTSTSTHTLRIYPTTHLRFGTKVPSTRVISSQYRADHTISCSMALCLCTVIVRSPLGSISTTASTCIPTCLYDFRMTSARWTNRQPLFPAG